MKVQKKVLSFPVCVLSRLVVSNSLGPHRLMLMLKLQYCGHLMQRTDSFEKTLMLGKIEGGRRRGRQRMRWLDGIIQKQRHYFANKGSSSQGYGFSCGHVWMSELDCEEG